MEMLLMVVCRSWPTLSYTLARSCSPDHAEAQTLLGETWLLHKAQIRPLPLHYWYTDMPVK